MYLRKSLVVLGEMVKGGNCHNNNKNSRRQIPGLLSQDQKFFEKSRDCSPDQTLFEKFLLSFLKFSIDVLGKQSGHIWHKHLLEKNCLTRYRNCRRKVRKRKNCRWTIRKKVRSSKLKLSACSAAVGNCLVAAGWMDSLGPWREKHLETKPGQSLDLGERNIWKQSLDYSPGDNHILGIRYLDI